MESDLQILLRLLLAVVLAAVLGWNREHAGKAAGLRTHMLVGLGATLFIVLGEVFLDRYQRPNENLNADPIRIIEAIVTGVSFLGAGMIFVSRTRETVVGLTTAASIWVTAAMGIAVGLERYLLAVAVTGLCLLILEFTRFVERDTTHKKVG
ncbi:MAG: MgtC/SapB family protein [Armatimonadaceae bacterium]